MEGNLTLFIKFVCLPEKSTTILCNLMDIVFHKYDAINTR